MSWIDSISVSIGFYLDVGAGYDLKLEVRL